MKPTELYALYAKACAALSTRKCESCGGPAQHVDPDGSTWCFECIAADTETAAGVVYPGIAVGGAF